jgi:virginiamycin B lyase
MVWASDFGSNSIVRFNPITEEFDVFPLPHDPGNVRQIHGRAGEVWGPESAADSLLLIRERS